MGKPRDELWLEVFLQEKRTYYEAFIKQGVDRDKRLITIASGAIGLPLLFIQHFVRDPKNLRFPFLLFIAWALFGGSIIATFLGIDASQKGIRVQIEEFDKRIMAILNGNYPKDPSKPKTQELVADTGQRKEEQRSPMFRARFFNWFAIFVFVAGIVILAMFFYSNLV